MPSILTGIWSLSVARKSQYFLAIEIFVCCLEKICHSSVNPHRIFASYLIAEEVEWERRKKISRNEKQADTIITKAITYFKQINRKVDAGLACTRVKMEDTTLACTRIKTVDKCTVNMWPFLLWRFSSLHREAVAFSRSQRQSDFDRSSNYLNL